TTLHQADALLVDITSTAVNVNPVLSNNPYVDILPADFPSFPKRKPTSPPAQSADSGLLVSLEPPLPKADTRDPEHCSKVDQLQQPASPALPEDMSDEDVFASLFALAVEKTPAEFVGYKVKRFCSSAIRIDNLLF